MERVVVVPVVEVPVVVFREPVEGVSVMVDVPVLNYDPSLKIFTGYYKIGTGFFGKYGRVYKRTGHDKNSRRLKTSVSTVCYVS